MQQYHHIAIVGASANPLRPSYSVANYLLAVGYDVIFINPRYVGQTILGRPVYASLADAKRAGENIEIVDVFRKPEDTPAIAQEAVQIGAKAVWLQLGISNQKTGEIASAGGLTFVQDRCIKIEHAIMVDSI